MDVSGVRSACVTASSSAVRSFSASRAASVCPTCSTARACSIATAINVAMASSVCRESTVPEIPRLPIGLHAHAHGQKADAVGRVNHRLVARQNRLQAFGIELRNHRPRAVDLLLVGQKQRRRAHFEGVHDLAGNAVHQLHHVAAIRAVPG